jgi:hypothetical protein
MQSKVVDFLVKPSGRLRLARALAVLLPLALTGCVKQLATHSVALANATAPVVDQATAAYQAAEKLHDLRVDYDAVAEFDNTQTVYNPRNIQPLLSPKDIDIRLAVLKAFQCYVSSLVDLTKNVESPALESASKSVGGSLASLGDVFAPSFANALGITPTTTADTSCATTSTTSSAAITTAQQNGISTAVNALGLYLVGRKIKTELPPIIIKMDPNVEALCKLLEKDIDVLQSQEKLDYDFILNRQTLFIRQSQSSATNPLNPQERREQIMKLPEIVRQERLTDTELTQLRASIVKLELTHHALATEAQGNNPESLAAKLGDLSIAGNDLGKFYSSLPTQ